MASQRQINVGGVPIGGGAPVVVQTMTKTETANLEATMRQIRTVAEAGADIVRVAVPRDQDVQALKTIVAESPIPIIADIHFNHTLAIKSMEAGAHCIRLNPGNIGGPDKVAEVVKKANELGTPMRIGVNSGSLPDHLRELEFSNPVEALVTAAVEFVDLMERLEFTNFKVSMKSTSVPNTIASNRLLAERIPYPLHLGVTEAGTKWAGSLKSAVGLGTLLADGIGDTIRISLSTFHAEEEVKVAWEILKALKLRERGPVLIACPTCGRLQFDMDSVVTEVERRLEAYTDPSRSRSSAAASTASARRATPTSASAAPRTRASSSPRASRCARSRRTISSTSCSRRSTSTTRPASRSSSTSARPPRPSSGWPRTRTRRR
jgi:(E)-4-hydroxy-3-methylbut-2-enyl-diphosphate synthase